MSGHSEWATPGRRELTPAYRSDQQIGEVLDRIVALPTDCTEVSRRRVVEVLDDLAEEMIGRSRVGDGQIRKQIERQRERFGSDPPADGSPTPVSR